LLWFNLQPGLVRDAAFVTMFIASVSTLLFNANPLLNFDGYYVLCDALDLPNLGPRSRGYWVTLMRRAVHGAGKVAPMQTAPGERKWLAIYAPLSLAYRLGLSTLIVLWVGNHSLVLGAMIAAFVAYSVVLMPLVRTASAVLRAVPGAGAGLRAQASVVGAALALAGLVFVVPLPFRTAAWGVVWLPDHARTRPQTDGFVVEFAARDGDQVVPGQLLLTLQDPALQARRVALDNELRELTAQRTDAFAADPLRSSNLREELQRVEGDLALVEQRIAQLEVRSQAAGQLVMPRQQDLLGSYVQRGTTLGYVLDRGEVGVRAAVPERDAALIRESVLGVEVRLAESLHAPVAAALVRDVPAASFELPGAALGDRGGGPFPTDPADREGLTSLEPLVLIDLLLPEQALRRVGGRVWVRFDHGDQPMAVQAYRRLRQLFLKNFSARG
jgi:putative peptide zinc metalloprotease protein